ncbi:DUF4235 domain-containing protein [Pseudonocardia lacus]|uniref:DUF4235 domain-containing protein n=1 Tax=Pseudonocardia lacus TaxID=2835865 RepID=UPI001BDD41FE|nr:DUF4235 domain-containing protein [Pseudonocardia lacus]
MSKKDGNELTGLAKLAYKPFGLAFGLLGGLVAGRVFGTIWKKVSNEDGTPQPLSDEYSTREVLIAATLQGAIFGLIKTAVDRYGMKFVRRFLDAPRPSSAGRKLAAAKAAAGQGVEKVGAA